MLVGFIAVVVILLVIVGLMSSGATSGTGGIDQTKAAKTLSEMSSIMQQVGFVKTISANSDYSDLAETAVGDGLGVDSLVSAGIVDPSDVVATDGGATTVEGKTVHAEDGVSVPVADSNLIKSKSISGIYYQIRQTAGDANSFEVVVYSDDALTSTMKSALHASYNKFSTSALNVANTADVDAGTAGNQPQGAATVRSR